MSDSKKSSKASSRPVERDSNPLAVLDLESIACALLENADNPAVVRAKAEELRAIAEAAYSVLAVIGSNNPTFEIENP